MCIYIKFVFFSYIFLQIPSYLKMLMQSLQGLEWDMLVRFFTQHTCMYNVYMFGTVVAFLADRIHVSVVLLDSALFTKHNQCLDQIALVFISAIYNNTRSIHTVSRGCLIAFHSCQIFRMV